MKRSLSIFIALVVAVVLSSCGATGELNTSESEKSGVTKTPDVTEVVSFESVSSESGMNPQTAERKTSSVEKRQTESDTVIKPADNKQTNSEKAGTENKGPSDETRACRHTFENWIVTCEPTCGTDGVRVRICSKCKEKESEVIPATGEHVFVNNKCKCGKINTEEIGTWKDVAKTVYCVREKFLHLIPDDNQYFCEHIQIGEQLKVLATDGVWYKVEYTPLPQGYAYVMCKYVTDSKDYATFDVYGDENYRRACVKDGKQGIYLCKDLSLESSVGFTVPTGDYYVIALSKSKEWAKVRFCGYDSEHRYYDGNIMYYVPAEDLYFIDGQ